LPQNISSSTTVPSATELKLRLVLLGFWPRAFEDFFLERRRAIVRALGPETKRQGRGRSMSRKRAKKLVRATTRSAGPTDKYFGDRLRARRIMMKMSQDDLGKSLGVTFQQIQKYEKGTNRMSAALMVPLAKILDVDVGYFYDEIPNTKRNGEIETPALTELALTLHGRRLIDAFLNLKNDMLRGAVADLAHVLARGKLG
jgi:transcriptional regulator with XRE-family HTH domain